MTAVRRMTYKAFGGALSALALTAAVPAAAQDADAPVDVTAAPPPSTETVGPRQLRDFQLNGTVTRPAQNNAPPAPVQAAPPAATRSSTPTPANSGPTTAAVGSIERGTANISASSTRPAVTGGTATAELPEVTPPIPTDVATNIDSPASAEFDDSAVAASPTLADDSGGLPWAWIAALIALVGGGAFIAWSRRNRRSAYDDPGRLAFAGLVPDAEPAARPVPPVRPRANPVPPRAQPAPQPRPAPPAAPAPKPVDDGLIVSTRLKPDLAIQFEPDRAVVTESDVMIQFDVVLVNNGSAPARDVLVEARMVCAHAGQDQEIGAFFHQPVGKGDRIAIIQPLGKVALKSSVRLPWSQLRSFEVEGRSLLVPLVAFNVLYNNNLQTSASYLVGRGTPADEKLGPFRLDLGPRIFRGLSARPHSMGLSR